MQQEGRYLTGLTGGVGAGKVLSCHFTGNCGFYVIQADLMARVLMEPGKEAIRQYAIFFRSCDLTGKTVIDRKTAADIIFNDPAKERR